MMTFSKAAATSACSLLLPPSAGRGGTFSRGRHATLISLQPRHHRHLPLGLSSTIPVNPRRHRLLHPFASTGTAQDNNGPAGASEESTTDREPEGYPEESGQQQESPEAQQSAAADATTEGIKEKLAAARASSSTGSGDVAGGFWDGVVEEVGRIEWPEFGKVLGTTGVVLSVIAGSSVALLTVNAILAELSDRVFAGRGVQDLLGG